MSVSEEATNRFAQVALFLLDILKRGFDIPKTYVPLDWVSLLEPDAEKQSSRPTLGEIARALAPLAGAEVVAPVMDQSFTTSTMLFTRGYIISVWVEPDLSRMTITVRFKEPVVWFDDMETTWEKYTMELTKDWPLYQAITFITLMALNKHVEDAVLSALQLMGFKTDRLREAVRRTKLAYEAWFSNT